MHIHTHTKRSQPVLKLNLPRVSNPGNMSGTSDPALTSSAKIPKTTINPCRCWTRPQNINTSKHLVKNWRCWGKEKTDRQNERQKEKRSVLSAALGSSIHSYFTPSPSVSMRVYSGPAADGEPLAVGDAKLSLWELSSHHTAPCALKITRVTAVPQCTTAHQADSLQTKCNQSYSSYLPRTDLINISWVYKQTRKTVHKVMGLREESVSKAELGKVIKESQTRKQWVYIGVEKQPVEKNTLHILLISVGLVIYRTRTNSVILSIHSSLSAISQFFLWTSPKFTPHRKILWTVAKGNCVLLLLINEFVVKYRRTEKAKL